MTERGHGEALSRLQEKAVAGLLCRRTVQSAARFAGVSYKTLKTWMALPAFEDAYRKAREKVLHDTVRQLLALNGKATQALLRNLTADKAADQIRAALGILDQTARLRETTELEERLAVLEAEAQERREESHASGSNGRAYT